MSDDYVCTVCGKRIHRSLVPNSATGNVLCCGRPMLAPGDMLTAALTVVWIALGAWLLRTRAEWGWPAALGVAAAAALAVVLVAGPAVAALLERRSNR